jgi:hypothetical protein
MLIASEKWNGNVQSNSGFVTTRYCIGYIRQFLCIQSSQAIGMARYVFNITTFNF